MNWRDRVQEVVPDAVFNPPADLFSIADAEESLGAPLPACLRDLLRESNGVQGEYSLDLIWPIERIKSDNLLFRTHPEFPGLYMPFQPCLFFGDAGNGDQFFFPVLSPGIPREEIFVWDHESDSRTWVASSIERYLQWSVKGERTP